MVKPALKVSMKRLWTDSDRSSFAISTAEKFHGQLLVGWHLIKCKGRPSLLMRQNSLPRHLLSSSNFWWVAP